MAAGKHVVFLCCTYMVVNHARSLCSLSISREVEAWRQPTYGTAARAGWTSASLRMSHNVNLHTGGQATVRGSRGQPINGAFSRNSGWKVYCFDWILWFFISFYFYRYQMRWMNVNERLQIREKLFKYMSNRLRAAKTCSSFGKPVGILMSTGIFPSTQRKQVAHMKGWTGTLLEPHKGTHLSLFFLLFSLSLAVGSMGEDFCRACWSVSHHHCRVREKEGRGIL